MAGLDITRALNPPKNSILFMGVPLPPSSNKQYSTFLRNGKIQRVTSPAAALYQHDFKAWAFRHRADILAATQTILQWQSTIEIRAYVIFKKSRLLTKDSRIKKLDISNRLKALHDLLADAFNIDDSHFSTNFNEKLVSISDQEQVVIVLTPRSLRVESDLYDSLIQEGVMNE